MSQRRPRRRRFKPKPYLPTYLRVAEGASTLPVQLKFICPTNFPVYHPSRPPQQGRKMVIQQGRKNRMMVFPSISISQLSLALDLSPSLPLHLLPCTAHIGHCDHGPQIDIVVVMHSIADLRCIQCHVNHMALNAPNQNNPLALPFVGCRHQTLPKL